MTDPKHISLFIGFNNFSLLTSPHTHLMSIMYQRGSHSIVARFCSSRENKKKHVSPPELEVTWEKKTHRINKERREKVFSRSILCVSAKKFMKSFSLFPLFFLCCNFASILLSISVYQHLGWDERTPKGWRKTQCVTKWYLITANFLPSIFLAFWCVMKANGNK